MLFQPLNDHSVNLTKLGVAHDGSPEWGQHNNRSTFLCNYALGDCPQIERGMQSAWDFEKYDLFLGAHNFWSCHSVLDRRQLALRCIATMLKAQIVS